MKMKAKPHYNHSHSYPFLLLSNRTFSSKERHRKNMPPSHTTQDLPDMLRVNQVPLSVAARLSVTIFFFMQTDIELFSYNFVKLEE